MASKWFRLVAHLASQGVTRGVGEAGEKGNERRLKKRKEPVARGSIPPRWFTGLNIPSCFASLVFANWKGRERERGGWGGEKFERNDIYICYKSRAKRKWREKKRRERVTGAKISDLDHTHARKKKEDGRKRDGEQYFTIGMEIEDESVWIL